MVSFLLRWSSRHDAHSLDTCVNTTANYSVLDPRERYLCAFLFLKKVLMASVRGLAECCGPESLGGEAV